MEPRLCSPSRSRMQTLRHGRGASRSLNSLEPSVQGHGLELCILESLVATFPSFCLLPPPPCFLFFPRFTSSRRNDRRQRAEEEGRRAGAGNSGGTLKNLLDVAAIRDGRETAIKTGPKGGRTSAGLVATRTTGCNSTAEKTWEKPHLWKKRAKRRKNAYPGVLERKAEISTGTWGSDLPKFNEPRPPCFVYEQRQEGDLEFRTRRTKMLLLLKKTKRERLTAERTGDKEGLKSDRKREKEGQ